MNTVVTSSEVAVDGPSGVAATDRFEPDLILLDVMVPELCRYHPRGGTKKGGASGTMTPVTWTSEAPDARLDHAAW